MPLLNRMAILRLQQQNLKKTDKVKFFPRHRVDYGAQIEYLYCVDEKMVSIRHKLLDGFIAP